jgi:hypothetical protein
LARLYLDDASRGAEIYEANRDLLASPDLLPIGAELVIPEPRDRSAFENASPQSALVKDASVRAAVHQNMVPVRPIPAAPSLIPRARLRPPIPID